MYAEGRSHDSQEMMPLKTGTANILLGAIKKYGMKVTTVPYTFHYHRSTEYRSKVIVDVGQPFIADQEIIDLYNTNPKAAVKKVTAILEERMIDTRT